MDMLIHAEGFRLSEGLRLAAEEKIGRTENFAPRAVRARITLRKESAHPSKKQYHAKVLIELPGNDISADQAAAGPLEALDLLAEKIEQRLRKLKTAKLARRLRQPKLQLTPAVA